MKNKLISYRNGQRGFTLIELLVVVTLIAILAVAVLATINPIEQRRKAVDTGAKSASAEILAASERYFATYGCYPWDAPAAATTAGDCSGGTDISAGVQLNAAGINFDVLEAAGEVKPSLAERFAAEITNNTPQYTTMRISEVTADDSVHVCFDPDSDSFTNLANRDPRNNLGVTTAGCVAADNCHICVPDTVSS